MLRAAIGFEHCVKNVVDTWMAQSGWAITRHILYPTYGKGLIINNDGWLTVPEGTAPGTDTYAHIDLRPLLDTSGKATMISFGYRAKLIKGAIAGLGNLCLWGSNPSTAASHALATFANLFPTGTPEGTECLVEIVFDLVSTYRYTYVNGVMLGAGIYTGLNTAAIKTGDFGIYWSPCPVNTTGYMAIRDIWVTDDLPGDGMTGRLGDMKVRPLPLVSAVGNGWSATDGGSLLDALNAPVDKVNPALVESSFGAAPLALKVSSALPGNEVVQAVQLILNAKGSSNTAVADVSMERNGVVTPKRRIQLDTAQKGRSLRAWPFAPDGSRWSNANLGETTIKITPE
jgi:hypothetical protein